MSDENKPDNIDEGDDLLSDFNDLFPEEDDDNLNELDAGDETDDLESLLDGLDTPIESEQGSDSDEDDIDALLDTLDESVSDTENISGETGDSPESPEAADEDNLDSLLDGLEEQVGAITTDDSDVDDDSDSDNELDSLLDEMIEEVEPVEEREIDLDDHELDLSIEGDEADDSSTESESTPDELITADEEAKPEQSVDNNEPDNTEESELDDLISMEEDSFSGDEIAPGAAAIAPAAPEKEEPTKPAAADKPSKEKSNAQEKEVIKKSPSKMGAIIMYLLLFITLGIAGGSLWMALQTQQAIDNNSARLNKLQQQQDLALGDLATPYNPLIEQNSSSIRDLDQRINELSKIVEGPLSHINASTGEETISKLESQLQLLQERLQQLEQNMGQKLTELKEELAKRPTVVAATTAPPLIVKSQSNRKPAVKLWALNLLSLASRKGASATVTQLQKQGVNASRTRFSAKDGKTWYRVRVTGFSSYAAAKSYAKEMPKVTGIRPSQTWVTPE